MARIPPLIPSETLSIIRAEIERHCARFKTHVTNMKCTLAYSLTAFEVYMQWYVVYDDMRIILGERQADLYAYSIAKGSNSFLWSTYFRKFIVDRGENPEELRLTAKEQLLMDFGGAVAANHGKIDQELFDKMSKHYNPRKMVDITSFAGQMIAACVFSNVMEVDLDGYLTGYLEGAEQS